MPAERQLAFAYEPATARPIAPAGHERQAVLMYQRSKKLIRKGLYQRELADPIFVRRTRD
jgi:hypothetical protein